MGCLLLSLVLSLIGLRIAVYVDASTPRSIIESMPQSSVTDEEFYDRMIVDLSVGFELNKLVNDRKSIWLAASGYSLVLGILLHACYFSAVNFGG